MHTMHGSTPRKNLNKVFYGNPERAKPQRTNAFSHTEQSEVREVQLDPFPPHAYGQRHRTNSWTERGHVEM